MLNVQLQYTFVSYTVYTTLYNILCTAYINTQWNFRTAKYSKVIVYQY